MRVLKCSRWGLSVIAVAAVGLASHLPATAAASCPNEALRTGASARLPDCRVYELVTPESHGRVLLGLPQEAGSARTRDLFPIELASPDGESFVFSTRAAPLQSPPLPDGREDGYEARRSASGWQVVRRVTPSGEESVQPEVGAISLDHRLIFVHAGPIQNENASSYGSLYEGFDADYLGDSDGHFELTGVGSLGSEKLAEGRYISAGGEHVIFTTGKQITQSYWCYIALSNGRPCPVKQLEPGAPPNGTGAIYDRAADGPTHVVSLLPSGNPPAAGEEVVYQGTSKDASSVAFKINDVLYVRVDNGNAGAERTESAAAGNPTYAGLSGDGRYLFYVAGGNVYRFDTTNEGYDPINSTGDGTVVHVSEDGSHVYFISESQVGGQGIANQPNLYVWSGGPPKYIRTLAASDVPLLGNWVRAVASDPSGGVGPGVNHSRATPNGRVLLFTSRGQLTPYDNAGHAELYRYSEKTGSLICVSCNPAGTPASADARLQDIPLTYAVTSPATVIHNLSEDGSRVFFESTEALVEGDGDGINDIYEWELPLGGGAPVLSLISSGKSMGYPEIEGLQDPNVLMGITPDGSDVFFRSTDALVPGAGLGGAQAIYDARVGGGFSQPREPTPCTEEACHSPAGAAPTLGMAASSNLHDPGNLRPAKKHRKHKCRRRSSKKHKRCIKRRSHRRSKRSHGRLGGVSAKSSSLTNPTAGVEASPSPTPSQQPSPVAPRSASASAAATGEFEKYGIRSVDVGTSTDLAARHPDLTTNIVWLPAHSNFSPQTENVIVDLPPGLYGNPNATPRCTTGEFISNECPADSQVGLSHLEIKNLGVIQLAAVYNLEPPHPEEEIARFGLFAPAFPIFIDVSVRTAGDYGVTAAIHGAPAAYPVEAAETVFWGDPGSPGHDSERIPPGPSTLGPTAFMTNPSACQQGHVDFSVTSYQYPGQVFSASAPLDPITSCEGLPFDPSFEAHPTSRVAGAPTGLKTTLRLPQTNDPDAPGTATMREARVTLPEGMTISSSAADGLAACSDEEVHFHQEQDAQCPDASKLGTATIGSPVLPRPLQATLYQRSPRGKGHQFGLWLVSDDLGLHVKLPGEIEPDPNTGQLTTVFRDLPQVPVEEISFDIWGGPRAPLKNPDSCGTYSTAFSIAPHSNDPAATGRTEMTIDEGCGARGFNPRLEGGATHPVAGAFSPFLLDLTRDDGDQDLARFEVTLPKGELAKLKGVSLCPDVAAQAGSCPAQSRIGSLVAAAGPGPNPLWLPQPGKDQPAVYLAGPYKDAPYSIVAVVPAQAGPFELGNVVSRSALDLDPETTQVTAKTDPLPQLVEGVPVIYRRLHVSIDRPQFTLNPTNCSEQAITSSVSSTKGAVAHPADRFQVGGCKALRFKPKLALKLRGGTKRGDYPALSATLRARTRDANIGRVSVALPHSEFLAQEHIVTICTRVRFAAHDCPKGSVYGKAKAWTPLLDKPLAGPVYLRSSNHPLPNLVIDLRGQIEVVVPGRIDSKKGGIRTTFAAVPDAPISKFVLKMRGGRKGLLTNSQDICAGKHRAIVRMRAQNGRAVHSSPVLKARCK